MTLRLGLTGGIGSGKSTVAQLLQQAGAAIIDADAISRTLTGLHGEAIPALKAAFDHRLFTAEGSLDRAAMRAHVFANPAERKRLEAILHPLVHAQMSTQAAHAVAAGMRSIVFEIPLLLEGSLWRAQLDRILVIDCHPDVQIQRIIKRDHLPLPLIHQILASQISRVQRLRGADWILCNEGTSLDHLAHEVHKIHLHFKL